jgi:hypothetical protein
MKETADKPRSSAPVRLVNVFFWQLAGIIIGGLIPFPILGYFARYSDQVNIGGWLCLAAMVAFFTAAIGGVVGTLLGLSDRPSPLGSRRHGRS